MITHEIYFRIPKLLQSSFLQTSLASLKIGNQIKFLQQISRYELIKTKKGVRLLGSYTKAPNKFVSKGLVILLHGWEGSIESSYIIRMANFLVANGFDVFRLNFRDHGNTHHLNEGIFLGTLIEEVYDAIIQIIEKYNVPTYVVGFSLGGNFAIRFGLLYNQKVRNKKDKNQKDLLEFIFAVSPALDPRKTTMVIDQDKIYKKYFLSKWKESLRLKEHYFPYLYHFEPYMKIDSIMELTEKGIMKYSHFKNVDDYFSHYTISNFSFKNLKIPLHILTAHDDPIIPVEDFYFLKDIPNVHLYITNKGGHNGFIMDFQFHCYYMDLFADIIRNSNLTKFF